MLCWAFLHKQKGESSIKAVAYGERSRGKQQWPRRTCREIMKKSCCKSVGKAETGVHHGNGHKHCVHWAPPILRQVLVVNIHYNSLITSFAY